MMMIGFPQRALLLAIGLFCTVANAQQPKDSVSIGQEICTAGYVMDEYCIDFGKLLDAQDFETLENPEEHSMHCLVDVSLCYETPFHILTDPRPDNAPTTYGPGWAVSDNSELMTLGRQLGGAGCTTCNGTGTVTKGLRMEVRGTVKTLDPPVIDLLSVQYLEDGAQGCLEMTSSISTISDVNVTTETDSDNTETPTSTDSTTASRAVSNLEVIFSAAMMALMAMAFLE